MDATVAKVFQETARMYRDRPAFKVRDGDGYHPLTFGETYNLVRDIGTGLQAMGVKPGEKIGLLSDNRLEWILCDLACICIGAADVPRGSDSTPHEIDYILSHADVVAVFVENKLLLDKVFPLRSRLPSLRFLVVMDPGYSESPPKDVYLLEDVAARGRARLAEGDRGFEDALGNVRSEDLATIIYTSGTTGEPKGVMLSHRNLMQNIEVLPGWLDMNENDRFLSILPPWHVFERMAEYLAIAIGASTAYTGIRTFASDMAVERPTFIASVPRIWEGIYTKVMARMEQEPERTRKIFLHLVEASKKYVRARKVLQGMDRQYREPSRLERLLKLLRALGTCAVLFPLYAFAQRKFAPIRGRTGGRLRAAISGGGALPPYVDEFFAAVGITLLEGYGLTETSPVLAARTFRRQVLGTVGPPIPETEIVVVDGEGEPLPPGEQGIVKCRGAQVMEGYYKRPEETARAIDDEGWFDTGDLGRMTIRGELTLTGRAKETIVLLGGENIEPTPIEDAITESPFISQVMVVGQDSKALGALVVPDFHALGLRSGLEGMGPEELCSSEAVQVIIREELRRLVSGERGFRSYERITRHRLLCKEFSLGEELTHTMKKRRNVIAEHYADLIREMCR